MASTCKFTVSIDIDHLRDPLLKLFYEDMQRLGEGFDTVMSLPIFQWNGETVRKNGSVASSPRDIEDLGNLIRSRSLSFDGTLATFRWDAPYASGVHNGVASRSGRTTPARPWVWVTVNSYYPLENFTKSPGGVKFTPAAVGGSGKGVRALGNKLKKS